MGPSGYLIDINVVSDMLTGALPPTAKTFVRSAMGAVPYISIITQIELLSWNAGTDTAIQQQQFIAGSRILDITQDVVAECVRIRKSVRLKTPDAIIAATAVVHNYVLISRNEKDFVRVAALQLINPWEL